MQGIAVLLKLKRNAPYPAFEGFRGKGYLSRLSWSFSANRGEPTGEEGERDLVRASGNPSPNALMLLRRILRKREVSCILTHLSVASRPYGVRCCRLSQ
jgi:hypothetical protein